MPDRRCIAHETVQGVSHSGISVPSGAYLGPKFGPNPIAKKYLLFPIDGKNFPIWKFWKIVIEIFKRSFENSTFSSCV